MLAMLHKVSPTLIPWAGPNAGHPTLSSRIQHHANLLHLYHVSLGHRD